MARYVIFHQPQKMLQIIKEKMEYKGYHIMIQKYKLEIVQYVLSVVAVILFTNIPNISVS